MYECDKAYMYMCYDNMFTPYFNRILHQKNINSITGPLPEDNITYYVKIDRKYSQVQIVHNLQDKDPVLSLKLQNKKNVLSFSIHESEWYYDVTLLNSFFMFLYSLIPVSTFIFPDWAGEPCLLSSPVFIRYSTCNGTMLVFTLESTYRSVNGVFLHHTCRHVYVPDAAEVFDLPVEFNSKYIEVMRRAWLRPLESPVAGSMAPVSNVFDDLRALVNGVDEGSKGQ